MDARPPSPSKDPERERLDADSQRRINWTRWGPYLADRQWGTVREDYSSDGTCWEHFPHDHARSRAYRWGEDGLLGFTDRECRLCVGVALWNGKDPILKERLYGLTGTEGNHGEDVKEVYHHLDATPTGSYCSSLYRYPLDRFPYDDLLAENRRRGREAKEYELTDTGIFDRGWADVQAEYAKAGPDDILLRLTITNRSDRQAEIDVLPTVWFRNTWIWGCKHDGCTRKPWMRKQSDGTILTDHETLGRFRIAAEGDPTWLFTENETNTRRLYGQDSYTPFTKDAFHRRIIDGEADAVDARGKGTKATAWYHLDLAPGESTVLRLRWRPDGNTEPWFGPGFDQVFADRIREADAFYAPLLTGDPEQRRVARMAFAGLIWTKQFYHLVVTDWLSGDPEMPVPPASRIHGRNADWPHLFARDVISMPDGWEYPWFAAWDLAFHCIPLARIDPEFAKRQLELLLRKWYLHPNGQIPAYEFAFGDVNPPVHAWAAWRVYRMGVRSGNQDLPFLERIFQKLLMNFTWWVNRKDADGRHLFAGGFLGLDNIGVFDRSRPLPDGTRLEQADGTAWMAFYAARMLTIALELARHNPAYEDIASKFFEHFIHICDAMNRIGGAGLWDEQDGFFYDRLWSDSGPMPLRIRSLVGLIPMCAAVVLDDSHLQAFPGFAKRLRWFLAHRPDLAERMTWLDRSDQRSSLRLLAIPTRTQLERMLARMLDEREFLSPFGIRSLSKAHQEQPFSLDLGGVRHSVGYEPGESGSWLFGGNSNWRGPVWFPINHLLIEALRTYHEFYGDDFTVELPTGSGRRMTLGEVANELARRLARLFLPDAEGRRPCHGDDPAWKHPEWRDLPLFYEYFHGDDGHGLGASHQTGWTALVVEYLGGLPPKPGARPA